MEQQFFSLNRTVCFAEIKKCQYGALHLALLEAIFNCLDYLSNLIFTDPSFTKTGLESTEQVVGFNNVVETVSKDAFQKFNNT